MSQLVSKMVLSVGLLCGLFAFAGGTTARGDSTLAPVAELSAGTGTGDEIDTTNLTCHGQVCPPGDLCCSCREGPGLPLQFFCGTPDFCPQGTICMIPPP